MTKTCCPSCKSPDGLTVRLTRTYELKQNERNGGFKVGDAVDFLPNVRHDSEVACECDWSGRFDQLTPATEKFHVVLIMDVDMNNRDDPVNKWDWKEMLGLDAHESVTVDGVNKL